MADTVFSVGLNSVEYYRELKKLGTQTERELAVLEKRIGAFERRADRALSRRLTSTQRHIQAELDRIAADGERANAEIAARIERDQAALAERRARSERIQFQRRAARTRAYARTIEGIERDHGMRLGMIRRGSGGMAALGRTAGMLGVPGLGRIGGMAALGPAAGVVGAGVGTAAFGLSVFRDAKSQSPAAIAAMGKAQSDLARSYEGVTRNSVWWAEGISRAVGVAGSAISRVWDFTIDTAALAVSFDPANIRGVNEQDATERMMDRERASRGAARSIGEGVFGVDPAVERRRKLNRAIDDAGIRGTTDATDLLERERALAEREAADADAETRRQRRDTAHAAARRNADAMMLAAENAAQRAALTDGTDDDKRAAQLAWIASLEESRARVMADEAIPADEKHNRIMAESLLLGARYAGQLKAIEDAENDRAERTRAQTEAMAKSRAAFEEQIAIDAAAAAGNKKAADALRAEADYRRRLEEIERLGFEGDRRRDAEEAAGRIRDAQLAGGRGGGSERAIAAGLAGGDTLLRQIGGAGAPAATTAKNTGEMVRVLRAIERKVGATVAVAG